MIKMQPLKAQSDFSYVDKVLITASKDLGKSYVALIWKDGKMVYKKESNEDFNSKEQAPIYLSSSWLTAAMVMTFVDQGKISLDDYVASYLPIFEKYGKKYITIRHCLTHFTGIESSSSMMSEVADYKRSESLEEVVNIYASKREIKTNPGTEYFYSHVGLAIAARVCEVVAKRSFGQLMAERIARPCGMKSTNFDTDKAMNPTSGGYSSAADYINFLSMLLNKGVYNGRRILSEASVNELLQIQPNTDKISFIPEPLKGNKVALGSWEFESNAGEKPIVFASPSLTGTFPYLDVCRNYAAIVLVKVVQEVPIKTFRAFKNAADTNFSGNCE